MAYTHEVEMTDICKSFGGIAALEHVNFCADRGEVHALMGENGAGKSTLMKILAGAYSRDHGEIRINGEKKEINSTKDGRDAGISVIYQEFALAPHLTVAENILIDNLGEGKPVIDWNHLNRQARKILDWLGFGHIDVREKVENLSVAYQQVVEISKALSRNSSVLVFDEPTAVLASSEEKQLFKIIETLKGQGVCIIYISHRLSEIFAVCDKITVLKDGKNVDTVTTKDITEEQLVKMMVGRDLTEMFPPRSAKIGGVTMKVENLCCGKKVQDVSFEVREGEVLGINGLVGAGRTETLRAVFGADKKDSGTITLGGTPVQITSSKKAVSLGIGMLPEDRKKHGVLINQPIRVNMTLASLKELSGALGWINRKKEDEVIGDLVDKLKIKIGSIENDASSLSGGNQQKVALAKWLGSNCKILIFDEPTRGVDVGAKVEIYRIINQLAEEGASIIMISSEMPEIIGMSDRVLVMREGKVMGELNKNEISEENLIKLSMGVENI